MFWLSLATKFTAYYNTGHWVSGVTGVNSTFSQRAMRNWLQLSVLSPSMKLRRFVPFVWIEQISRFTTLSVLLHLPLTAMITTRHYDTRRTANSRTTQVKVKEVDSCSAFIEVPHTLDAQVQISQCYLQITTYLPLPRKHSPDGASQTEVADI